MQDSSPFAAPPTESLSELHPFLVQTINQRLESRPSDMPRHVAARQILELMCRQKQIEMTANARERVLAEVLSAPGCMALIQPMLDDGTITEIMVNGPESVYVEQISSAVDLIVQQARFSRGHRKVISLTEVMGMEGETVVLNELFKIPEAGSNGNGAGPGIIGATDIQPMFEPRLKAVGYHAPPELFGADLMQLRPTTKRR